MTLVIRALWAVAALSASHSAAATPPASAKLDRLFSVGRSIAGAQVRHGIHIVRLSDQKVLYSVNAEEAFNPASVTKILLAATLLERFGPLHRFKTRIGYTGSFKNGIVEGDLVARGDGDPLLVSEGLWRIAADLSHRGLKEVRGSIAIDNELFADEHPQRERRPRRASTHSYDAPVSAFGINFNTFAFAIFPGTKVGAPARVTFDPYPLPGVPLTSQVTTAKAGTRTKINATRITRKGQDSLHVVGHIGLDHRGKKLHRSVSDSVQASGAILAAFLKGRGITVHGGAKSIDPKAKPHGLVSHDSESLREILHKLMVYSNNYVADVLLKRLGAERSEDGKVLRAGSYTTGLAAMKRFLAEKVGVKDGYVLENGSGLSTKNRVRPSDVTAVLGYMAQRWDLYPDFLASLSMPGDPGTLKKRMNGNGAHHIDPSEVLRAKTGTLTEPVSVSAIAGYTRHPDHGLIAFAVLQNGVNGKKQPNILELRARQDAGLAGLAKHL